MIREFEKYAGIRILKFFLLNPRIEIHIKEVAKKLNVSPSTAKFYCDLFLREGIFVVEVKGNLKIFSLNNTAYIKELKKIFALFYLKEFGLEKIVKGGSLAVYGSYASGEFNEKSDIDIIVICEEKDLDKNLVLSLEKRIGKKIQLIIIPYHKWEKMKGGKDRRDPFAMEVLANHILIKGNKL